MNSSFYYYFEDKLQTIFMKMKSLRLSVIYTFVNVTLSRIKTIRFVDFLIRPIFDFIGQYFNNLFWSANKFRGIHPPNHLKGGLSFYIDIETLGGYDVKFDGFFSYCFSFLYHNNLHWFSLSHTFFYKNY